MHMGVRTLDIHVVCVCQPVLSFDTGVHCIDTNVTLHILRAELGPLGQRRANSVNSGGRKDTRSC